jgi:hypothetical protein
MMKREKNHAALATFITRMVTTTVTPIVIGIAPAPQCEQLMTGTFSITSKLAPLP